MVIKKNPEIIFPENSKKYVSGPIVLLGPPGIGKSTIGKKVTEEMNIPFFDLDDIIAEKVGAKTTKEIIEKKGRPYFWKLCHICLKETFQKKKGLYILAFGGGVTYHREKGDLKDKNKVLVKQHAFTICLLPSRNLDVSVDILWPRQKDGKRHTGIEKSNQLQSYLKARFPQYIEDADRIVYTHHASIGKIVSTILEILKR